jgi:VanZ family protein
MRVAKNIVLYIIFFLCIVFLFVGGPNPGSSRSVNHIWDLGHILLFALGSYIFVRDVKILSRQSFFTQLIIIFILSIILGITTEYMQVKFHRTPDIADVGRDLVGSLLAVAFFSPSRKNISSSLRIIIQVLLIILFIYQLIPFSRSLADEIIARYQFPILSNFETPFEIDRWGPQSHISVSENVAIEGSRALQIKLTTAKYSGVFFKYFPCNWKNHSTLHVNIINPDTSEFMLVCRIEDRWHEMFDFAYNDRYNHRFKIHSGLNTLLISLTEVITAPEVRKMDIKNITQIGFFSSHLPHSRIIYIDNVFLI